MAEYRAVNSAELRQRGHEYNVSEEGRAKRKAYNAEYRRNHEQYYVEYMTVWRVEHADHCRNYTRRYTAENALRIANYRNSMRHVAALRARQYRQTEAGIAASKAHKANRRAKAATNGGSVTRNDVEQIRKAQTDRRGRLICWRCGEPITDTPHLDHFIPLDKGGPNNPGNLRFMHALCNLNKSNKHPHELGMLI